ncbi:MAG: SAF domain-containing protein [Acidimicrobiia bacterium]
MLLSRPPYLRWAAAAFIVIAALLWDLNARATEPFPFAATTIESGQAITQDQIVWEDVPRGSLEHPNLVGASALVGIIAGDPLTPSLVGAGAPIPDGWWSVPVRLPQGVASGTRVRLVFPDGSLTDGVVVTPASQDDFGSERAGVVSVPGAAANEVAIAAASDALVVMISPATTER